MKQEINNIDIIPAIFIGYREDGNVLLKCLQGKETVNRAFESNMLKNIKNPKYLLLGIITGINYMQLNIIDAYEFKKYFETKWKNLIS